MRHYAKDAVDDCAMRDADAAYDDAASCLMPMPRDDDESWAHADITMRRSLRCWDDADKDICWERWCAIDDIYALTRHLLLRRARDVYATREDDERWYAIRCLFTSAKMRWARYDAMSWWCREDTPRCHDDIRWWVLPPPPPTTTLPTSHHHHTTRSITPRHAHQCHLGGGGQGLRHTTAHHQFLRRRSFHFN